MQMTDPDIKKVYAEHLAEAKPECVGDVVPFDCVRFARAVIAVTIEHAAKCCDAEAASVEGTLFLRTDFGKEIGTAQMMGARNCATRIRAGLIDDDSIYDDTRGH